MRVLIDIHHLLDKLLKTTESDMQIQQIKHETNDKVDDVTASLKEVGRLQIKVMNKTTTTYFIAKAAGVLR
jgi:hypothetical protein